MHPHVRSFIVNHHARSVAPTTPALDCIIIGAALVPTTVFLGYVLVRLVYYIKKRIRKRATLVTTIEPFILPVVEKPQPCRACERQLKPFLLQGTESNLSSIFSPKAPNANDDNASDDTSLTIRVETPNPKRISASLDPVAVALAKFAHTVVALRPEKSTVPPPLSSPPRIPLRELFVDTDSRISCVPGKKAGVRNMDRRERRQRMVVVNADGKENVPVNVVA